jgi:hypothetical protein
VNLLALNPEQAVLWWVALAIGAVVVAVVIVLFLFLSRLLHDIRFGVAAMGEMAEQVQRGSATGDLRATAMTLREIREEIRIHDDLLSR